MQKGAKVGWYVEIEYKDTKGSTCRAFCHPNNKDDFIKELKEYPHARFFPLKEVIKIVYKKYDVNGKEIECQQNCPI